jgi:tRNA threonylcarbamoyl adenosine modification protein (Sua5/YciO/YrdC/YwlC family)
VGAALSTLDEAAEALARGGVVVIPTDTVYGLAARFDDATAVRRIYELKGRPSDKALQVLVPDEGWLDHLGAPSASAHVLAQRFWPGPLTIVVASGSETIGLRVPANEVTLELLKRTGPLAATSANQSGRQTPGDIESIRTLFGDGVDCYVDGGRIDGTASTVVDTTRGGAEIVREGAISSVDIAAALEKSI